MDIVGRFRRLTDGCQEDEQTLTDYFFEIEKHIQQVEIHCNKIKVCVDLLLKELNDSDFNLNEVESELPVEDYRVIRARFGEEEANKLYYDVKFGKVPLRFVQRYLSQINTEEKQ